MTTILYAEIPALTELAQQLAGLVLGLLFLGVLVWVVIAIISKVISIWVKEMEKQNKNQT